MVQWIICNFPVGNVLTFFLHFRKTFLLATIPGRRSRTSSTRLSFRRWCRSRTSAGPAEPSTLTWWTRTRPSSTLRGLRRLQWTTSSSWTTRPEQSRSSRGRRSRRRSSHDLVIDLKLFLNLVDEANNLSFHFGFVHVFFGWINGIRIEINYFSLNILFFFFFVVSSITFFEFFLWEWKIIYFLVSYNIITNKK